MNEAGELKLDFGLLVSLCILSIKLTNAKLSVPFSGQVITVLSVDHDQSHDNVTDVKQLIYLELVNTQIYMI